MFKIMIWISKNVMFQSYSWTEHFKDISQFMNLVHRVWLSSTRVQILTLTLTL